MYNNLAKPFFMGKRVVYMPSCHSTNDLAADIIKNDRALEGTIVITDHQTAGRGQQGNWWEADQGKNLTFSLILTPKGLALADHFMLNIIISLGISDFLKELKFEGTTIKWPNDIYHPYGKIGGILIQNTVKSHAIEHSIVGIGLNVNQQKFNTKGATSITCISGMKYSLAEVLDDVVHCTEVRYMQFKSNMLKQLTSDYKSRMMWKDEVHTFEGASGFFTGIVRGINTEGQLEIECEEETRYFNFKEVKYIK